MRTFFFKILHTKTVKILHTKNKQEESNMNNNNNKTRRTDGVHAGGRPALSSRPTEYYIQLLEDYNGMTLQQLASKNNVSKATICKHLNFARRLMTVDE